MSKTRKRDKFLLLRWGGFGDLLFLTAVARVLHDRGYDVDIATNEKTAPLLLHNPYVKNVIIEKRFGYQDRLPDGKPVNLVLIDGIWVPDMALYKNYMNEDCTWRQFNIANYFRVIEGNTHHREISSQQNSMYANVYDTHLAWAGIDPNEVDDSLKRPVYFTHKKEDAWAEEILSSLSSPPVMIQTQASGGIKSISPLGVACFLRDKGENLLVWNDKKGGVGSWALNGQEIPFPEGMAPMRATAALIKQSKFVVTTDTCVSHLAEALKKPHITFYTSVPQKSISKYYRYEIPINSTAKFHGQTCKCYQLVDYCPRIQLESNDKLTDMEKQILSFVPAEAPIRGAIKLPEMPVPEDAHKDILSYFGVCTEAAFNIKLQSTLQHLNSLYNERGYCVASIDLSKVIEEHYDRLCKGDF